MCVLNCNKKERNFMKQKSAKRKAAAAGILISMILRTPTAALAASPEFARTSEEWSTLQDNVLEYGEIADLIHEYNVTVQNNAYEYNEFVKDYGRTKEDTAAAYRDLASELLSSRSGDDSASAMISDMQLELQAKNLREQADDNIEDSQIYYLQYSMAEDNLVLSAQSKYISYFSGQIELESAKEQLKILENAYSLALVQRAAGTVTDTDVLDAQEAVLTQEKTISQLEQEIENTRQSLIVMLGWKESDAPQIEELPEFDFSLLDAIDLESDKQKALENNYTLKINQRKLENAQEEENKKNMQTTIEGNERQIAASVSSAWASLQTAKLSYDQAAADLAAEERNMEQTACKWNAGMITQYEYEDQQSALVQKQLAVETAKLNLMDTYETYQWNVNGLASAE